MKAQRINYGSRPMEHLVEQFHVTNLNPSLPITKILIFRIRFPKFLGFRVLGFPTYSLPKF